MKTITNKQDYTEFLTDLMDKQGSEHINKNSMWAAWAAAAEDKPAYLYDNNMTIRWTTDADKPVEGTVIAALKPEPEPTLIETEIRDVTGALFMRVAVGDATAPDGTVIDLTHTLDGSLHFNITPPEGSDKPSKSYLLSIRSTLGAVLEQYAKDVGE